MPFKRPLPGRGVAKRVGKEEPEEQGDYEFVPPDFDEDGFIHKEMISFRTTSTLIVMGIIAAALGWLLYPMVGGAPLGWFVGIAITVAAFFALKPLYKALKFDISHYGRREWIGTGFLLFFTFLAFFMILLNPPFSDFADPHVVIHAAPNAVEAGQEVVIDVFVTDNDAHGAPVFAITDAAGTAVASEADLQRLNDDQYQYRAALPVGQYFVEAAAEDAAGNTASANTTVLVEQGILDVEVGDLTSSLGVVFVKVPEGLDIWAVYADMDSDRSTETDRVYFEADEALGGWKASANFAGWKEGNNTFTVFVEEKNTFEARTLIPGGVLRAGPFTAEVDNVGEYAGGIPKRANPTDPPARQAVPGIELPILAVGLLGLAFVARRR